MRVFFFLVFFSVFKSQEMNFTNNMECMVEAKSCFKLGTFILELTPGEKPKTKQQNQKTFPPLANALPEFQVFYQQA